jgi:hypothetical protein
VEALEALRGSNFLLAAAVVLLDHIVQVFYPPELAALRQGLFLL